MNTEYWIAKIVNWSKDNAEIGSIKNSQIVALAEKISEYENAQPTLAPDSPYVCLHCGAHASSDHLPWCKSLPQNGGR